MDRRKGIPVWVWIVGGLIAFGAISAVLEPEESDEPEAPKGAEPVELSAADVVDYSLDEARFCRVYAKALSTGASEDLFYGNFLRSYQERFNRADLPPAQEVFDEAKSRC